MSKHNRKAQQNPQYTYRDITWEEVLGKGYTANNVAYDFGQSDAAAFATARFSSRAAAIRQQAADLANQTAALDELANEVEYLESFQYTRDLLAGWWKRNAGTAAVLFTFGLVIGTALVHIFVQF